MPNYQHILLATDLMPASDNVVKAAHEIANKFSAKLSIIHVIEPMPVTIYALPFNIDINLQLMENARAELAKLGNELSISAPNQFVEVGSTKVAIIEKAKELGVDLIVLGSHGHHGLASLLGSTANAIANSAPCDVIIIRGQHK